METRSLGTSGLEVSVLSLGAMTFGDSKTFVKGVTSSVILGARTVAQLDDDLHAADVELAAEDVEELDAISTPDWAYPYGFIARMQPW